MLLFCFVLGALVHLEVVFRTLRLRDISQSPEEVLAEEKLLACFSSFEKNCSPLIFVTRYRLCKKLEQFYPSEVKLVSIGWNKWCFCFETIKPVFRVTYRGKEYYLNDNNKLWPVDIKENKNIDGEIAFNIPKLIISSDIEFILSCDNKEDEFLEKRIILDTSIDISKLKLWYNKANELGWLKFTCACCVQRDRQHFFIKFYLTPTDQNGQKSVLVLNDDISTWNTKDLAIKKLWGGIDRVPQGMSIEAQFDDKILVRPIM